MTKGQAASRRPGLLFLGSEVQEHDGNVLKLIKLFGSEYTYSFYESLD
jgi:hypothetical protein